MNHYEGIQIIGTQRSGSNLLRVILDQSDALASPHPPHLLTTFKPLLPLYGALSDASYSMLVSDIVDYVEANPVPWEGIRLDKEQIIAASRTNSLIEVNRLVYEAAAAAKNARYWCCKSMGNVHYADELEAAGLNLKYIYLFRDGRDVAASFKKAVVGEKHIYHLARQWKLDQEACLRLEKKISPHRFYKLSYETLIAEPERTVKSLCRFLGIPYVASMLSFYQSDASKRTAEAGDMWRNLKKPIMKNNSGTYIQVFEEKDLEIFELVAGATLLELGYPLHSGLDAGSRKRYEGEWLAPEKIREYDALNARLKQETVRQSNPRDLENRRPQETLLQKIRNRNLVS